MTFKATTNTYAVKTLEVDKFTNLKDQKMQQM
jgi:hypothetical protein